MAVMPRQIYFYLVCLITLVMIIIGTVQIVNRTIDLVIPPEPYRPVVEYPARAPGDEEITGPTREEREANAMREEERQRRENRRNAIRGMIGNLTLLGLAIPIYWVHWRRIRDEKPQ